MNVLDQGDVSDLIFQQLFPVVVDVPIDLPPEILGILHPKLFPATWCRL